MPVIILIILFLFFSFFWCSFIIISYLFHFLTPQNHHKTSTNSRISRYPKQCDTIVYSSTSIMTMSLPTTLGSSSELSKSDLVCKTSCAMYSNTTPVSASTLIDPDEDDNAMGLVSMTSKGHTTISSPGSGTSLGTTASITGYIKGYSELENHIRNAYKRTNSMQVPCLLILWWKFQVFSPFLHQNTWESLSYHSLILFPFSSLQGNFHNFFQLMKILMKR